MNWEAEQRKRASPTFLDRQLAGSYGKARTWYMQGPWSEGTPSQGNQSRLTPAQTYRAAIKAIDSYCQKTFSNKTFAQLAEKQQDDVLTHLEKGEIELEGVKGKSFFEAFLQNTLEGFLSDPIYGGNRDMVGWKLIGFPGTRYDYRDYVSKHGEKLALCSGWLENQSHRTRKRTWRANFHRSMLYWSDLDGRRLCLGKN